MNSSIKITSVNSDLINKLVNYAARVGISFVLLSSMPSVAYAKEKSQRTINQENPIEYSIDNLEEKMKEFNDAADSSEVSIPDKMYNSVKIEMKKEGIISSERDKITVGGLRKLKNLSLNFVDDYDLSFLNYCSNLSSLTLNGISMGKGILQLPNLKNLDVNTSSTDYENLAFINNSREKLNVSITSSNPYNIDLLPTYTNIDSLDILVNDETNLDFSCLTFLKKLNINGMKYDVPIFFSKDDYDKLVESGVNVSIKDDEGKDIYDDVMNVDEKLNSIISSFSLDENSTPEDMMDKILIYVLDNYEYDSEISRLGYVPLDKEDDFYGEGYLTAVFERDSQIICGNYSAITSSLAHRLGIQSYLLGNDTHSWNLVEYDGCFYYYDATVLDGSPTTLGCKSEKKPSQEVIKSGGEKEKSYLRWYKVNYDDVNSYRKKNDVNKDYHLASNIPFRLTYEYEGKDDVKVTISSKNNVYTKTISKAHFFGLLSCTGMVEMVNNKKREKKRESSLENNNSRTR